MIINKIRLQEENPMASGVNSWPLPYCDLRLDSEAGDNGYLLKQVVGLEPPEMNEVVEGFDIYGTPAFIDVPEKRELVFQIGLSPNSFQTFGDLRDSLYSFISRTILISLMNDSITLAVSIGYIRRFEIVEFSNKPEVKITIQCQDGPFTSPYALDIPVADRNSANPVINYQDGTAPTGLDLKFMVSGSAAGFSISNHSRVHSLSSFPVYNLFEVTYPLINGDIVTISTHPRKKEVILERGVTRIDLAGYLNAGAVWPLLYPGVNAFTWTFLDSWLEWHQASYTPKYWGV